LTPRWDVVTGKGDGRGQSIYYPQFYEERAAEAERKSMSESYEASMIKELVSGSPRGINSWAESGAVMTKGGNVRRRSIHLCHDDLPEEGLERGGTRYIHL